MPEDISEDIRDLVEIGRYYYNLGFTKFEEWSERMLDDLGEFAEAVRQLLQQVHDILSGKQESTPGLTGTETEDSALGLENITEAPPEELEDTDLFVTYRPQLKGAAHPGNMVETKTMATVPLPPITYKPNLPAAVIETGKLSALQLEAVAIAGQQNNIVLPGGYRGSARPRISKGKLA